MVGFGATILATQGFWIVQSQSDLFIAGRVFSIHELGLYAEALFLTQIFAAKFVPPLNEVAFPAYSRLQNNPSAMSYGFLKAMRLIMLIACPLYIGLSVTAAPAVATIMGPKWLEAIPLIEVLALAMPFMTLQILFGPPVNALGKPRVSMQVAMFGALLMPVIYIVAVRFGALGLSYAWLIALPTLLVITILRAGKLINVSIADVANACWPGFSTALLMGGIVWAADQFFIAPMAVNWLPVFHLFLLMAIGGISYIALLWITARDSIKEIIALVAKRKAAEAEQPAEASPAT